MSIAALHVVTGKGGVGKTSVSVVLAKELAESGQRVLLAEVEGRDGVRQLLGDVPVLVAGSGSVALASLDARAALEEYLDNQLGARAVGRVLGGMGAVEFATALAPGTRDLLLLGKLHALLTHGEYDAVVLDAPAVGRIEHFLLTPAAISEATAGTLATQSAEVAATIAEAARIHIVTLAEELALTEALEATEALATFGTPTLWLNQCIDQHVTADQVSAGANPALADLAQLSGESRAHAVDLGRRHLARLAAQERAAAILGQHGAVRRLAWRADARPWTSAKPPSKGWFDLTRAADPTPGGQSWVADLLHDPTVDVVVCLGAGGVGKTTVSAALAVAAAQAGRKVTLLTIDPAQRLGQALGADRLVDEPHEVAVMGRGNLWALQVDAATSLERLVRQRLGDRAETLLSNRLYRLMVTSLTGTADYVAMDRLARLYDERVATGQSDLLVIDTPPSRSALDFLEGPSRFQALMSNRMVKILSMPGRLGARAAARAIRSGINALSMVVGQQAMADVIEFASAFDPLMEELGRGAAASQRLIQGPRTAFVVVSQPESVPALEGEQLVAALEAQGLVPRGVLWNRVAPAPVVETLPGDWEELNLHVRARRDAQRGVMSTWPASSAQLSELSPEIVAGWDMVTALASQLNRS